MSVQFGTWNFDGQPVGAEYIGNVRSVIGPYAPQGHTSHTKGDLAVLFCPFHTTKESTLEIQPYVTSEGTVISWDGRLDNRDELIGQFEGAVSTQSTDILIVRAAFERWNIRCLAKLLGDWALAIWNQNDRCLILAKDPIGTRQLYYVLDGKRVTWSTTLDPLVLLAEKPLALDEEYVAGWLSAFPATNLTPYAEIHSVPPCSFVRVTPTRSSTAQYWTFDARHTIRYRTDAEFEEHFRILFKASVRRRLRSHAPVLAELSGGMDSSSIVCMADRILSDGLADAPRLDTISYYDESEPNWDERPYFLKVEEKRGQTGCHVHTCSSTPLAFPSESDRFLPAPSCVSRSSDARSQFAALLSAGENRVVLSGIGGDEVAGGVPTPVPELADLLVRVRAVTLAQKLTAWSLSKRQPWLHMGFDVVRGFCFPRNLDLVPWLDRDFARRHHPALAGYRSRLKLFGPLPSFQENMSALEALRRQLGCTHLASDLHCEMRYPYLDRDLLAFMYALPREQVVRPHERRSLMRRALRGLVPREILDRRRKAFISHGPLLALSRALPEMTAKRDALELKRFGVVDVDRFLRALEDAGRGLTPSPLPLIRAIRLEKWLQGVSRYLATGAIGPHVPSGIARKTALCHGAPPVLS
jgi:asparagine synthase (glutamine-hydrolysing)